MKKPINTLVAFATRWGPQFGGINSFNQDLLCAFSAAFYSQVRTICVVLDASDTEKENAARDQVTLISLGQLTPNNFSSDLEQAVSQSLKAAQIQINMDETVWLGHDRITGGIALAAAKV